MVFSFSSSGFPMVLLGDDEEAKDFCRRFMILLVGDFGLLRVAVFTFDFVFVFAFAFAFAFVFPFAAFAALSPRSDLDLGLNLEIDLDLDLDLERERKDRALLFPELFSLEQLMSSEEATVSIPPWFPAFINEDGNRIFMMEGFFKEQTATQRFFRTFLSLSKLYRIGDPIFLCKGMSLYFFRSSMTLFYRIEDANLTYGLCLCSARLEYSS